MSAPDVRTACGAVGLTDDEMATIERRAETDAGLRALLADRAIAHREAEWWKHHAEQFAARAADAERLCPDGVSPARYVAELMVRTGYAEARAARWKRLAGALRDRWQRRFWEYVDSNTRRRLIAEGAIRGD